MRSLQARCSVTWAWLLLSLGGPLGAGCGQDTSGGSNLFPFDPQQGTAQPLADPKALVPGAPTLKLTMVDVGQGDGLVLELPGGAVVAVDGGPDPSGSYQSFVSALPRVDYIVLSHAHSDHYTGLSAAIAKLPKDCAARVFDPGYDRPTIGGYQSIKSAAGCRYRTIGKGMTLDFDRAVLIEVLGVTDTPFPAADGEGINNTSVVTYFSYGRFSALLTGDAQTEAERRVYADQKALHANILKLGHHGSCNATATTFLRAVAPDYALISAGIGNSFGHPNCQTIDKLRAQGSHWLRTDLNGTISIVSDGEAYVVSSSRGSPDLTDCPRSCASPTDF